jgi:branched-chain amino acid transport system ATP-binding protein
MQETPQRSREQVAMTRPHEPLLSVRNLCKRFGALAAIDDLSFDVEVNELFGIAGPNGAGKSTLLNLCTGQLVPDRGELCLSGRRINGQRPHQLCHAGIARTFQIPMIFESMSIRENVAIGAMFGGSERFQSHKARDRLVHQALEACQLSDRAEERAGTLGLLARKLTMLAAALATQPRLVFMDEPLGGLIVEEVDDFVARIRALHARFGITFVLVEHKMRALADLSDRIMIMHYGRRICLDEPAAVMADPQVIDVYLGDENIA